MPQPAENSADAAVLIAAYEAAQAAVDAAVGTLTARPLGARSRTLHRTIRIRADVALSGLGARADEWTATRLPAVAGRGAAAAVTVLPDVAEPGVDATAVVADVADELVQALARATDAVRTSLAAMLRAIATDPELATATRARDVAPALARLEQLADGAVYAVRYANGTRMPLGAYADMLIRTITARAYNAGTLQAARAHGVGAVEVQDGLGCQWPTGHGHPPAADGMVVSVGLAEEFPLAHPNCQRGYLLRPDVVDPSALDDGELPEPEPTPADTSGQTAARAVVRATVARYRARLEARARRLATRRTRRST